ncbi:MAG: PA0069 family radical SAM protein [Chromatiales bacterium]|nr:PA0069 family radical SAM protein [Chromatiales bacterium]
MNTTDGGEKKSHRGRGAVSNRASRFLEQVVESCEDGWEAPDETAGPATRLHRDKARTVITRNVSPDVPFEQSINPYRGCQHGCSYCYARPTHAYLDLSPGLDFETEIFYKPQAAERLRAELAKPGYRPSPIALGANTDAYQPSERKLRITRAIVELLHETRHPVVIITKSDLVLRDIDLLADMARDRLAGVFLSVTTLDGELARRMEPRAAAPHRRIEAVRQLSAAGVPTGVLVAPVVPGLNDNEIEAILSAAASASAQRVGMILLRLPREVEGIFTEWLHVHYPEKAQRVLSLVRQCRGGRLYDSGFGTRMRGTGPVAELIRQRFAMATRRLGLDGQERTWDLSTVCFRAPEAQSRQMRLCFD